MVGAGIGGWVLCLMLGFFRSWFGIFSFFWKRLLLENVSFLFFAKFGAFTEWSFKIIFF